MSKTINDFIKELQSISEDKRELPLVVKTPNGMLVDPSVKMIWKDDNFLNGKLEKIIITYD